MDLKMITKKNQAHAEFFLQEFYNKDLLAAEKKPYLTNLRESTGPYLAVENADGDVNYLLDAASQIATLGLGFNPSAFFGVSHFIESWCNDHNTKKYKQVRLTFEKFLSRKLDLKFHTLFAQSGAEANELALGLCFKRRAHNSQNKILSFKGSFHGRMMMTLAATWNKSKRAPFEWPQFDCYYSPYPEVENGLITQEFPDKWRLFWENSPCQDFEIPRDWQLNTDALLKKEIEILTSIRENLINQELFAILVEPMQCEGGDRYSSDRFHNALLLMAKSFRIPVIYDEVQTGFHLGNNFFWHQSFNLRHSLGGKLYPDYVVCAKKAQLGIVLSQKSIDKTILANEQFNIASMIKGMIQAQALDQSHFNIQKIAESSKEKLDKLVGQYSSHLYNPRIEGLAFSFDFIDASKIKEFIQERFNVGLLFYPAGHKTLRFRLNTAYKEQDIINLFSGLENLAENIFNQKPLKITSHFKTTWASPQKIYGLHAMILSLKLQKLSNIPLDEKDILINLTALFKHNYQADLIELNASNFNQYADQIEAIQKSTYEEQRQTSLNNFKKVAYNKCGIALIIVKENQLIGQIFSSPLSDHPFEKGVRSLKHYNNPHAYYNLDLTTVPSLTTKGLGRDIKSALTIIAMARGCQYLYGRNRDQLASRMFKINLSLGAIEKQYNREDYHDNEKHRDVILYQIATQWKAPIYHYSSGLRSPISAGGLNESFMFKNHQYLVNKVCLSNFVSKDFITSINAITQLMPEELRHIYTTSGQSECADKLAKTIWFNQSDKKKCYKMLTFSGHHFGPGSFLSRSLDSDQFQEFFPVKKLPHPTEKNYLKILTMIKEELTHDRYLGIWLEPVLQKSFKHLPYPFLQAIKKLAQEFKTPLIYNETASCRFHYSSDHFFCSADPQITPDISMCYLGGQAGIVFTLKKHFITTPLMLISTWDGDEYSCAVFHKEMQAILEDKNDFLKKRRLFEKNITLLLEKYHVKDLTIKNGVGHFYGEIPANLQKQFDFVNGKYLICPNTDTLSETCEQLTQKDL